MRKQFAWRPEARAAYLALRGNGPQPLYQAVREVLTQLLQDSGSRQARGQRYLPDVWAVRVRAGDARWLILWRYSETDDSVIEIHYLGPAPGETA